MLPKISNYRQYSNDNYGKHSLKVDLGEIEFYYSYETIVAFATPETGLVVFENIWGTTPGKRLNWINPDHKCRESYQAFEIILKEAIARHIQ